MEEIKNTDPAPLPLANPMATASLVLGIASVVLFILFVIADERWLHDSRFPGERFFQHRGITVQNDAQCIEEIRGSGWEAYDVLSVFMLPLFWLTSIPAIFLGHMALRKIGRIFRPVKGKGVARAGVVLGYLMTFVVPLAAPCFSRINERTNMTQAISNCRRILVTLRLYSADNSGCYPDNDPSKPTNSNDAFRLMFVNGEADNEMIFGCPLSPYQPDGVIGKPPDFREALKPGENHWAMTSGLNDAEQGTYPLLFENSADAGWPPKWNTQFVEVPKPGRVWRGNKIIVGMIDCSVAIFSLDSNRGDQAGLSALDTSGANLFSQNDPAKDGVKIGILDIAR